MRRLVLAGALIAFMGCQNIVGPFRPKSPQRVDDPSVTIPEQQRRDRAAFARPDETVGPMAGPNMPLQGRTTIDR
jgi:hypothetical protein